VKKIYMAALAVLLFLGNIAVAQTANLSGVINRYSGVTAINTVTNKLTLDNASAFSAGDRILIIQMKGVGIDTTNTINFGDVTGAGLAGNHEFCTIQSISGSVATLKNPLCKSYNAAQVVQIVSAPKYKSANIVGSVTADAWDGTKGGIVVIDVKDTLTFGDIIDVSELGFKGGDFCSGIFDCTSTIFFDTYASLPVPACTGGAKGEGVALMPFGKTNTSRAKCANGGGAANKGNNGGAGGGNGGAGGRGGDLYSGCSSSTTWSPGGAANLLTNGRIFFAGGGGGGYQDNNDIATAGGNAGGTVLIRAAYIDGNGLGILANGADVLTIAVDEASGGGGAGGTVHLHCTNFLSALNIFAFGGEGGSNDNVAYATGCHGTGGGGGGGQMWVSGAVIPLNLTFIAAAGPAGIVLDPLSSCTGTTYNALDGDDGVDNTGLLAVLSNDDKPDLGKDTGLCAGTNILLNPGGFASYLWSTGATTPTLNITAAGTYWVRVPKCDGTFIRDTIVISAQPSPIPNLGPDTILCVGQSVSLYPGSFPFYTWNTGAPTSSILVNTTGTYSVIVKDLNGCTGTDSKAVVVSVVNALATSNFADSLCLPSPFILNSLSSGGVTKYKWDLGDGTVINGVAAVSHVYTAPGNYYYSLVVSNAGGCTDSLSDSIYVGRKEPVTFTVNNDKICVGENIACFDTGTQNVYSWAYDFGDGLKLLKAKDPVHVFESAGNYAINLTSKNLGCPEQVKTVNVTVQSAPLVNLGPDTSYCVDKTGPIVIINSGGTSSATSYLWNTGSTSNVITVAQAGTYWIKATTSNGCTNSDTIIVAEDCYLNIPNAFTPNNDQDNDYFMPMNLMSNGIRTYSMELYNRWGELVFKTTDVNSRGWDGKFGGSPQPMGVYVYVINVTYENISKKTFKGNVTLVR
jgi:gliding motility-associated-like protein